MPSERVERVARELLSLTFPKCSGGKVVIDVDKDENIDITPSPTYHYDYRELPEIDESEEEL